MAEENKKYKVIIVDDDKFLLNMYGMKFEKEGVEIIGLESGEELIKELQNGLKADLLLLDIIIPGMDGLATLEKARKEDLIKDMKVVMLTNQGGQEDIEKAKSLGISGYIVKATAIPSEVVDKAMSVLKENK
jgi:CheY-like chemotaxis protein